MNRKKQNTKDTAFVLTNYFFKDRMLEFEFVLNELLKKENIKKDEIKKLNIKVKSEIPLPEYASPIVGYFCKGIRIVYSSIEKRLEISTNEYERNSDLIIKIFKYFAELKITEIADIGINYNSDCNTKKKKLNILSEKIGTLKNWKKNIGFKLIIPMNLKKFGCIATYYISKIAGGTENNIFKDYIYRISANYSYNLDNDLVYELKDKIKIINKIKKDINLLSEDFELKCKEIINL